MAFAAFFNKHLPLNRNQGPGGFYGTVRHA